ncbi:hypothetical protein BASA81_004085 [Batrachochytrium salamandrivorans]|nr:hypothetical protein BASA81_004085 [Batrachochytrium salamandrivorans]
MADIRSFFSAKGVPSASSSTSAPAAKKTRVVQSDDEGGNDKDDKHKEETSARAALVKGEPVLYLKLAEAFERVALISSRLAIQAEMTQFFSEVMEANPSDLLRAIYLSINQLGPAFANIVLGVGDALLIRVVGEVTGKTSKGLKSSLDAEGDLGIVVMLAKQTQKTLFGAKPKPLTVHEVFAQFHLLAKTAGAKSTDIKAGIIKKLLVSCSPVEAKFIIRGLQGKLRIGLAEQTILVSLAHAVHKRQASLEMTPEEAVKILKQVYSECPSYDEIVPQLLLHELGELHTHCHIKVGVPVKPMLAKPTKGVGEILNRFEASEFTCEFKYDGERAQIHYDGSKIEVFSRNLESNTSKYPDAIEYIQSSLVDKATTFILDSEVVAYDSKRQCILPFQVLSTRARKDVKSSDDVKVQIALYLFDIIYLNGQSLLKLSLKERRVLLQQHFREVPHQVHFAIGRDLQSTEDILDFFNESVKGNCEGLMIKTLVDDATYEPSKRSLNWLKLKKDYMDNLSDSLDLVVIGAYLGKGKRTGTFGAFLCACYDEESEDFQSVCCVGTGFSDESLETFSNQLRPTVIADKPRNVVTGYECDVWFQPEFVWEIKAADLSLSPQHKGALGLIKSDRGVGLRFPRFLRIRDDKKVEDATSAVQVEQMYRQQAVISQGAGEDEDDDE